MNLETRIAVEFARLWLDGHWLLCLGLAVVAGFAGQLAIIWHLLRRNSYLTELCFRLQGDGLTKANETATRALQILTRELKPSLSELVEQSETDFTLKP